MVEQKVRNIIMDHPRVQKCRQWAQKLVDETKSTPAFQRAAENPRPFLYGALIFFSTVWLLSRALTLLKKTKHIRPSTPDLEKPPTTPIRKFQSPQRPLGGIYLIFLVTTFVLISDSMATCGIQAPYSKPGTQLGRAYFQTSTLPTI